MAYLNTGPMDQDEGDAEYLSVSIAPRCEAPEINRRHHSPEAMMSTAPRPHRSFDDRLAVERAATDAYDKVELAR